MGTIAVWEGEEVLDVDGEEVLDVDGDGVCITMWMYLIPLNCTLKNGQKSITLLCIVTIKKKKY